MKNKIQERIKELKKEIEDLKSFKFLSNGERLTQKELINKCYNAGETFGFRIGELQALEFAIEEFEKMIDEVKRNLQCPKNNCDFNYGVHMVIKELKSQLKGEKE